MKTITIWSTIDKNGVKKHNHIEDGWVLNAHPNPLKPEYSNQRAWGNLNWIGTLGYLTDDNKVEKI